MIIEGFGGANPPACNNPNSELGISLARSSDLVRWTWSPMSPLRSGRIGRKGPCGDVDMPAWQLLDGRTPTVVTPNLYFPPNGIMTIKRYKISPTPAGQAGSNIVGIAAKSDGTGYWEAAAQGGVFAYGTAASHGSKAGQPLNAP